MSKVSNLQKESLLMLKETSRTFFIPISFLESTLKKTVGSAYLCMRAIDEIEDHPELEDQVKINLLRSIQEMLATDFDEIRYLELVSPYEASLPPVTMRLADWISVCPEEIRGKVMESTAIMAGGMAKWVEKDWVIKTKEDLDDYTYYVAGLVGAMLSDIWKWYDGTDTDYELAIGFGRGLQAVNILRNQDEDFRDRGVRFIPFGWTRNDVFDYARENFILADVFMNEMRTRNIYLFCKISFALAKRTLKVEEDGREKMTCQEVVEVIAKIKAED